MELLNRAINEVEKFCRELSILIGAEFEDGELLGHVRGPILDVTYCACSRAEYKREHETKAVELACECIDRAWGSKGQTGKPLDVLVSEALTIGDCYACG